MRERLFCGKRIDNGEWVYGDIIHRRYLKNDVVVIRTEDSGFDNYSDYEVDPSTVGQHTGLTDLHNNPIIEGHIIKAKHTFHGSETAFENKAIRNAYGKEIKSSDNLFSDFCHYYRNYVVEYSKKKGAYIARNGSDQYYLMQLVKNHSAEIIGNIHDNPEILKGE